MRRTDFTMERERPPALIASGELEDQAPEEVTYTAIWTVEARQNGGRTDPSWDAYPSLYSVLDAQGEEAPDESNINDAATNAIEAAFNQLSHDFD